MFHISIYIVICKYKNICIRSISVYSGIYWCLFSDLFHWANSELNPSFFGQNGEFLHEDLRLARLEDELLNRLERLGFGNPGEKPTADSWDVWS